MKIKIRDFIHESVDIDVCDDYTEQCYIAFCGPMWLTPAGEQEFRDALDIEVDIEPGKDLVCILVDRPDEEESEKNLAAVTHLFYAMAGYDATVEEYDRWFMDHEPEEMEHENRMEMLGQIIDIFEDFLDSKRITIPNDEKDEDADAANIYGTDYGFLSDQIEATLINWGLIAEEERR